MKLGICCDHTGFGQKQEIAELLHKDGIETVDFGTFSDESMDYPDVAHPLANAIVEGKVDAGVAMCGTGNGMAITLNHHKGIRAGLAWNEEVGRLTKRHNNANVLVLSARFTPADTNLRIIQAWLDEKFEGGRHQRRIDKIEL